MKSKLNYSHEALRDLDEIWDYVLVEFSNQDDAENVVTGIMNVIGKLKDFPEMGTPLSSVVTMENDYRFVISGNYMAFYRHMDGITYVDRILYARRDYLRILLKDLPCETK